VLFNYSVRPKEPLEMLSRMLYFFWPHSYENKAGLRSVSLTAPVGVKLMIVQASEILVVKIRNKTYSLKLGCLNKIQLDEVIFMNITDT
jgi:hypothetical protein